MRDNGLLKVISVLLQYPDEELIVFCKDEGIPDIGDLDILNKINYFLDYFNNHTLEELQENYVETFDFNDEVNLYLTFSKDIDDKERSDKLVLHKEFYRKNDLIIDSNELPDYYPLILEFMSIIEISVVKELFEQHFESINRLKNKLKTIHSPYEKLIDASIMMINNLKTN